jgi:hypothetical protein
LMVSQNQGRTSRRRSRTERSRSGCSGGERCPPRRGGRQPGRRARVGHYLSNRLIATPRASTRTRRGGWARAGATSSRS